MCARGSVELELGKRVTEVKEDSVTILDKASKETYDIPAAMTLWSTGVAPLGVVKDFIRAVPEQTKRHGIYTDKKLQAYGTDNVYAMGDCASVRSRGKEMIDDLKQLYETKATSCEQRTMAKPEAMGKAAGTSAPRPVSSHTFHICALTLSLAQHRLHAQRSWTSSHGCIRRASPSHRQAFTRRASVASWSVTCGAWSPTKTSRTLSTTATRGCAGTIIC